MTVRFSITARLSGGLLALVLAVITAPAQEVTPEELEARREQTRAEYQEIARQIALSQERRDQLAAEIAGLKKDAASMTAELIQAAKTEKKLAQDIEDIEERLTGLREQQDGIRLSLKSRRAILAEVLAALQRMGLNPPPAILVRPEDALGSVRSAILLGAVVPELRSETEILLADLTELNRVAASIDAERVKLAATIENQIAERERLSLLLEEKQRLQTATEGEIAAEKAKAEELAAKATSMQDLISSLETEIDSVRKAREEAARRQAELERLKRENRPVPEGHALNAALPFDQMKGKLALPVSGRFASRFGESDSSGGHLSGDTVQTQSGSIVTAPADSIVLFAGRFRSYGQLLILDAGGGYHVVMAGMSRLNVSQGQSVLAGEPVGAMGDRIEAGTALAGSSNSQPVLYIEFRKDKKPINPAEWWLVRLSGRTGNDT